MIALLAVAALAFEPPALGPGDALPPLEVIEWVHGEPYVPGASGKWALVEFTATWCGPCKDLQPEITRISRDYADRLDVVSVHVQEFDAEDVTKHVAEHADGLPPHVALGSLASGGYGAWMTGAGFDGIPALFLLDGSGTLAWAGFASSLPWALDAVLEGPWDMARARADFDAAARRQDAIYRWSLAFVGTGGKALPPDELLVALDAAEAQDPLVRAVFAQDRFDALAKVDRRAALEFARELTADPAAIPVGGLNAIAWALSGQGSKRLRDVPTARILSQEANERTRWREARNLDTWAYILWVEGDREGAIAFQEKAVQRSREEALTPWLVQQLEWYRRKAR